MSDNQAVQNTDREIWRGPDEGNGSFYADSIHVTEQGGIGINVGGTVFVKPVREWHKLAAQDWPPRVEGSGDPAPGSRPYTAEPLDLMSAADAFDEIEVNSDGFCRWTDVANALSMLRAEIRALPRSAASTVEPVLTHSLDLGPADFVLRMHPDDQFRIATRVAGNVGYDLVPEPDHPDSPHAPTTSPEPDAVREKTARDLYEAQHIDHRRGPDGLPIAWADLASFCKELHYEDADALLARNQGQGGGPRS